jgi:endonuclease/exonuclease/phosphatase (EEP) superfamily protein YafD
LSLPATNVLMCNRDADRLLALLVQHQPDLLVTLERDAWWQAQLDTLLAD